MTLKDMQICGESSSQLRLTEIEDETDSDKNLSSPPKAFVILRYLDLKHSIKIQ